MGENAVLYCEIELSKAEAVAVLSLSEPTMDNLFVGLVANDYAVFSSDFDTYIQASIPDSYFAEWKHDLDNQLGNYLSREVYRVTQSRVSRHATRSHAKRGAT